MKKIIPFLLCMLIALCACEKDTPNPPASVDSMQFEGVTTTLNEGESINLSQYLVITPASVADTVTVEWSSNNEEIATVSASGSVETLRAGDVTITAKAMDKTATISLTIEEVEIKEFTIPATLEVYVGEKIKFPINDLKPKNAPLYRFEWEADNDGKIPTYSEGKWYLKADKEREYTLTASVDDADEAKCQVKFVEPSVSKLTFNPTSYTVEEAGSLSLKTNLQITAAEGFKSDTVKVTWSSSKESVATIDQNGKVQAIAAGKATITAKAGGKTATCTVEVTAKPGTEKPDTPIDPSDPTDPEKPEEPEEPEVPTTPMENGHEYVDLGLSVMWATCNVGANSPESCGDYFAWGETATKNEFIYKKYTFNYQELESLPISKDAARANWGGKWRMPTRSECEELINNCTWKLEAAGYTITSNINGKSIFLPFTGSKNEYGLNDIGDRGYYYTSTVDIPSPGGMAAIYYMYCSDSNRTINSNHGYLGRAVRPVFTK